MIPREGRGGDRWAADTAQESLADLVALPLIGLILAPLVRPLSPLIGLILLPKWCYDSIVEESGRSGRSAASLVAWALAWSLAMALGITLLTAFSVLVAVLGSPGWRPGLLAITAIIWLATPFVVGALVGWRTLGLGGFAVGFVGLVIGSFLGGVLVSAVAVVVALVDASAQSTLGGAFIYIPVMTISIPTLTGAQFGIGLLVATVAGRGRSTGVGRGIAPIVRFFAPIVGFIVGFLWIYVPLLVLAYFLPQAPDAPFGVVMGALVLGAIAGTVVWWRTGRDAIKRGAAAYVLGDVLALLLLAGAG